MVKNLDERYFDWMCSLISAGDTEPIVSYSLVLNHLHSVDFNWIIPLDQNRADDGISLRYHFGSEENIPDAIIADGIDIRPCSVLEMMVALALRCENDIMQGTEERHVDRWFWVMMCNLGLLNCTDDKYDAVLVEKIISRLLNRTYSARGAGGLVTIPNCKYDLRKVEIWYQMMWYLETVIKGEKE